jgi:hypothetical protein
MLCLCTRLSLFPENFAGTFYDDGGPSVGGLLHKAPGEEKLELEVPTGKGLFIHAGGTVHE